MAKGVDDVLVAASDVARTVEPRRAPNGIRYASFADTGIEEADLARLVQAVPQSIAKAVSFKSFYFVPLTLGERRAEDDGVPRGRGEGALVSPVHTTELEDLAICHRNVALGGDAGEGVFISSRLMHDRFALAFEFFINVSHGFVEEAGVPAAFADLVWSQAGADVRGETSQDAWEARQAATAGGPGRIDEKARGAFHTAAFSDAVAIYMLSLALDFDYSELREREYPLLAPQALAERLRLVARLLPPNPDYEFAILYRRRG